ncbi:MAG: hypothetical protein ACYTET_03960 [Planctomycetota bacterium]|jgi:hypothetical protein
MLNKLALTIRFLLFCLFFLPGIGAIVLSIIAEPELVNYYKSRHLLWEIEHQNKKIQSLTTQYQAQIDLVQSEPNILARFAPNTFGTEPKAPDTIFPKSQNDKLKAETERILSRMQNVTPVDPVPHWLGRILQPKIRRGLFLSGAGLVLITFIFFGTTKGKLIEKPRR